MPSTPQRRIAGPLLWIAMLALLGQPTLGFEKPTYTDPVQPENALEGMEVEPGFEVQLAACEPLIADPVSFCWALDGSLWVVEMGDYPLAAAPTASPDVSPPGSDSGQGGGRVKRLVDTDGDGRFDQATIFLERLNHPTSVTPWQDGILIAAAPDLIFARDVDGDGRADERKVLLTGFGKSNAQHQVNSLGWGLDNRMHAANGDSGGVIGPPAQAGVDLEGVDIHGHDFLFDPVSRTVRLQAGMSQHTRFRDDWGNWFGGNSVWPLWHDQLPARYLNRNPQAGEPESCVYMTDPAANPPVFPTSEGQPRLNELEQDRRITSACGGCVYRDDRFGIDYRNSVFVCDPANNLVHHLALQSNGSTFVAVRPDTQAKREFLTSRDAWFRPVFAGTGPDGALYVADMYRLIIEHPDYFERNPESLEPVGRSGPKMDDALLKLLRRGSSRGRIYRIVKKQNQDSEPKAARRIDVVANDLIGQLESRNGIRRDLAHVAIVSQKRRDLLPAVRRLTQHEESRVRVQAWAVIAGLDALTVSDVLGALADPDARARRWAIGLAESKLKDHAVWLEVAKRTHDSDPGVRLQAVLTLGGAEQRDTGQVLASTALRHLDDPILSAAVLSADPRHTRSLLAKLIEHSRAEAASRNLVAGLMQAALRNDDRLVLAEGLRSLARLPETKKLWRLQVLGALLKSLDHAALRWHELSEGDEPLAAAVADLQPVFDRAQKDAADREQKLTIRIASMPLIGRSENPLRELHRLGECLTPDEPLPLQQAAIKAMLSLDAPEVANVLLDDWESRGPRAKQEIVKGLLERRNWTLALLAAVEDGTLPLSQLSLVQREQLVLHYHRDVRRLAKTVLGETAETAPADADYVQQVLAAKGDARRGVKLFAKHCGACHQDPPRRSAGPPLSTLTQASRERICQSVVDPNRVIEPAYASYTVATADGKILSGVIRRESAATIGLVDAAGVETTIPRADIQALRASDKSLMPEKLRQVLQSPQDLADIITALRTPAFAEKIRQAAKFAP